MAGSLSVRHRRGSGGLKVDDSSDRAVPDDFRALSYQEGHAWLHPSDVLIGAAKPKVSADSVTRVHLCTSGQYVAGSSTAAHHSTAATMLTARTACLLRNSKRVIRSAEIPIGVDRRRASRQT